MTVLKTDENSNSGHQAEVLENGSGGEEDKENKGEVNSDQKNGNIQADSKKEEEEEEIDQKAEFERSQKFNAELKRYHDNTGTPFARYPKINGKDIDLYKLYSEVTSRGGWIKVNQRNEWDEVLEAINFHRSCVNAPVAVKYIYIRYLDRYEKLNFLGEEVERDEDDEELRHKKLSTRILHAVPMTYNYAQHVVSEANRIANKLSTDYYKPSEYEKLFLSLLSPLPNEQDFAINVCTLKANETKATLRVEKCPKLIDALLAHAGIFNHYTTRDMFTEYYSNIRQHSLQKFWNESLAQKNHILELSFGDYLETIEDLPSKEMNAGDELGLDNSMLSSFLSLHRGLGTHDYIGQRVHQVTSILRNLTFVEDNSLLFARNETFIRFLVMCANIRWNNLHHMALDMMGNIATDIELADPITDNLSRCLLHTVIDGLESEDRGVIISCMEILYKLCRKLTNEDYIHKCFDKKLFEKIAIYLCLNDIMLLLYTLECIYALSALGEKTCNAIVHVRGVLDTLVSLVTVEAQSFGADGCILMRVVETIPGALIQQPGAPPQLHTMQTAQQQADLTKNVQASPMKGQVAGQSGSPKLVPSKALIQQQSQQSPVTVKPSQQQILQENDQFAQAWIKATCEASPNKTDRIEQQELYKLYVQGSSKIGRRGIVTPNYFPKCVRAVFGMAVGPINHDSVMYYDGVKLRKTPLTVIQKTVIVNQQPNVTISQQQQPVSVKPLTHTPVPIQKQIIVQKSTPVVVEGPTQNAPTPVTNSMVINNCATPQIIKTSVVKTIQAPQQTSSPIPAPSAVPATSSSLIKSLLANKVTTSVPTSVCVATPVSVAPEAQLQQPPVLNNNIVVSNKITATSSAADQPSVITSAAAANQPVPSSIIIKPVPTNLSQHQHHQSIVTNQNNQIVANNPIVFSSSGNLNAQQVAQRQQLQKQREMAQKLGGSIEINSNTIQIQPVKAMSTVIKSSNEVPPLAPLSAGPGVITSQKMTIVKIASGQPSSSASMKISNIVTAGDTSQAIVADKSEPILFTMEDQLDGMTPGCDSTDDEGDQQGGKASQVVVANKMLADLLEKKSDPPQFENSGPSKTTTKRKSSEDEEQELPSKRLSDEGAPVATSSAANLYAEMAAEILEDEDETMEEDDEEEVSNVEESVAPPPTIIIPAKVESQKPTHSQGQSVITLPIRQQIIMAPNTNQQQVLLAPQQNYLTNQSTATTTIKTESGYQTVPIILQHSQGQASSSTTVSQTGAGNIMHRQIPPGQTQYMLAKNSQGQTYVVATQTPMQQQMPTLLLTQTPQQQGTNNKTIIILQQPTNQSSHSTVATPIQQAINSQTQKIFMTTQQGQQMVMTQRPVQQHQIVQNTVQHSNIIVQQSSSGHPQIIQKPIITGHSGVQQQTTIIKTSSDSGNSGAETVVKTSSGLQIKQIIQQQPVAVTPQPQITQKVIHQPVVTPQQSQSQTPQTVKVQLPSQVQKVLKHNTPQIPAPVTQIQQQASQPTQSPNPITVTTAAPPQPVQAVPVVVTSTQTPPPVQQTPSPVSVVVHQPSVPTPPEPVNDNGVDINWPYVCDWRGCPRKKFKSANEVYLHACSVHCPDSLDQTAEIFCQWGPGPNLCDNVPRKRFSLMTHFFDRHCTAESFKAAVQRRLTHGIQTSNQTHPLTLIKSVTPQEPPTGSSSPALSTSSTSSNQLGSGAQPAMAGAAALHAIKRHALEFANPKELMDDNEGPVTKSIRLTASLILRNLVNYSDVAKRMLRLHETHLAQIALSNVESSRTISQVLYEMNDCHPI